MSIFDLLYDTEKKQRDLDSNTEFASKMLLTSKQSLNVILNDKKEASYFELASNYLSDLHHYMLTLDITEYNISDSYKVTIDLNNIIKLEKV